MRRDQSSSSSSNGADAALAGFQALIAAYDDPAQPYPPRTATKLLRAEEPYDHLSRFREWSAGNQSEDAS